MATTASAGTCKVTFSVESRPLRSGEAIGVCLTDGSTFEDRRVVPLIPVGVPAVTTGTTGDGKAGGGSHSPSAGGAGGTPTATGVVTWHTQKPFVLNRGVPYKYL